MEAFLQQAQSDESTTALQTSRMIGERATSNERVSAEGRGSGSDCLSEALGGTAETD